MNILRLKKYFTKIIQSNRFQYSVITAFLVLQLVVFASNIHSASQNKPLLFLDAQFAYENNEQSEMQKERESSYFDDVIELDDEFDTTSLLQEKDAQEGLESDSQSREEREGEYSKVEITPLNQDSTLIEEKKSQDLTKDIPTPIANEPAREKPLVNEPIKDNPQDTSPSDGPNPFVGKPLFVDPNSLAANALKSLSVGSANYSLISTIANQPQAAWFGDWNQNIASDVNGYVSAATNLQQVPVLALYNIPLRDCFGYSGGGATSVANYKSWIDQVSNGISNRNAIVILEPDALPLLHCLNNSQKEERYQMLSYAVERLSKDNVWVYLDAGHSNWISPIEMSDRLLKSNISKARGFTLNVSNFYANSSLISYGNKISDLIGGGHYIIDTSRNGNGSPQNGEWCNPSGMALGTQPQLMESSNSYLDGFLWIKRPGESDGTCNGGPPAGNWWLDYALDLARN